MSTSRTHFGRPRPVASPVAQTTPRIRVLSAASVALPALSVALLLAACSGNLGSSRSGSASTMTLDEVSNGFGQLVPFRIFKIDPETELPTPEIVSLRTEDELISNLRPGNEILPVPKFEVDAVLPNDQPGNHFLYATFSQPIDIASVIDPSPGAQANSGLVGTLTVIAIDPITGESLPVRGRAFIDGYTLSKLPSGSPPTLQLERWVGLDDNGRPFAIQAADGSFPGLGFPGTEANFQGANQLVSPNTFVFVADDGDAGGLADHDTFPRDREIRMTISTALRAVNGKALDKKVLACTTVGEDLLGPEIGRTPPPLNTPLVSPGGGDSDVDPLTTVRVEFSEPIQPLSLGSLDNGKPPLLSASLRLEFGPDATRTSVPFAVRPVSIFDLSAYELIPAFFFPGSGPNLAECATFSRVDIHLNAGQVRDLAANEVQGQDEPQANRNLLSASTFFNTGEGPGLVNAPVSPDTIYAGRQGALSGVSIVDLNGFGQSTGNPEYDETLLTFEEGNTFYPVNPNVRFQGSVLRPSLQPGTCTIDGGSAGVFTLTKDSSLNDLVARPPIVTNVSDMMIGHALDTTFNNGPFPFGCQSGGGNLCALDGLKLVAPFRNINGMIPVPQNAVGVAAPGAENIMSWAPHPNPPPILFPPLCVAPYLNVQEPTSVDTIVGNLLGPGDAFGAPGAGVPPSGLLTPEQNVYFQGPSLPQQQIGACLPFMVRQQVGHYLYVIDRPRAEVTVFNSNRMTIVERIPTPDPTSLAMSTDIEYLAVTNQLADVVSFIDINPTSATFHQVFKTVAVGDSPRGIAWEPDNEDILVCNEGDNSVSVISAFSLTVRKTVSSQLNRPFDVAMTPRQFAFGFARGVYFGYVLNRSGDVALFESGPNSVNGWGYDDIIGVATNQFLNPKSVQVDTINLDSAVWIVHEGPIDIETGASGGIGEGAVSNLAISSAIVGQLPLNFTSLTIPQYRDMSLEVNTSLGQEDLSGVPVDIAFDNQRNLCGEPNVHNTFSAGAPVAFNGKNLIRPVPGGFRNNTTPQYAFIAVPNSIGGGGVIDVLNIAASGGRRVDTNPFLPGQQSIPATNVTVVVDYFRQ